MANPDRAVEELRMSWKRVALRWGNCQEVWKDSVRRDFEEKYWTVLTDQTEAAIEDMSRVAEMICLARRHVR